MRLDKKFRTLRKQCIKTLNNAKIIVDLALIGVGIGVNDGDMKDRTKKRREELIDDLNQAKEEILKNAEEINAAIDEVIERLS